MEYNKNKDNQKIGKNLIKQARQTNLIHYLRTKHSGSIQFAAHPDEPDKFCWRGTGHDSITFFSVDYNDTEIFKYYRWSNSESDDGITYLVRYEGYSFQNAVRALAYFNDPFTDEDDTEEPDEEIQDSQGDRPSAQEDSSHYKDDSQEERRDKAKPPTSLYTMYHLLCPSLYPDPEPQPEDPYKIPYGEDEEEYEDSPF